MSTIFTTATAMHRMKATSTNNPLKTHDQPVRH